jgi:hypothetical protein
LHRERVEIQGEIEEALDDDEFNDHVESLPTLHCKAIMRWFEGKAVFERKAAGPEWPEVGQLPLREGKISRISELYQQAELFKYDIDAWESHEPTDWNLWRRMKEPGAWI